MVRQEPPLRQRASRMSPTTRRILQVLGPVLLVSGFALAFVVPLLSFQGLGTSMQGGDLGGAASSSARARWPCSVASCSSPSVAP